MALRENLLKEALSLSSEERAELASQLLNSLDANDDAGLDSAADEAWAPELTQRARDMLDGKERGLDFEDVMSKIAARIRGQ